MRKRKNSKKSSVKEENKVVEELDINNATKSNETLVQLKKLMEAKEYATIESETIKVLELIQTIKTK